MIDIADAIAHTAAGLFRIIFWVVGIVFVIGGVVLYHDYHERHECETYRKGLLLEVNGKKTCVEKDSLKILGKRT